MSSKGKKYLNHITGRTYNTITKIKQKVESGNDEGLTLEEEDFLKNHFYLYRKYYERDVSF